MHRDDDGQTPVQHLLHPSEKARLEATALVASRVSREESHAIVRRATLKTKTREMVLLILLIAVALLVWRNYGESNRTRSAIEISQQVNCKLYSDIAKAPLTKQVTTTGLTLVADFRNNYYTYRCEVKHGPLPKPDKRLLPFLNPAAK